MKQETKKFWVRGDHPILRRIDWVATGREDLDRKYNELITAGYEVKVEDYETEEKP